MIKTIRVKLDVIESMLYFWQATNSKEKVGENYICSVVDRDEMKSLYNEEFTRESARKVLSAISNREILNSNSKIERKFWNNNMWMMEDLGYTDSMVAPIKKLNLDDQLTQLSDSKANFDDIEVYFIPGVNEEYTIRGNKLFINFFRVTPDLNQEGVASVGGVLLKDYVAEKLQECVR